MTDARPAPMERGAEPTTRQPQPSSLAGAAGNAVETAHAIAWVERERARWHADDVVLLCVSGRGDKDVAQVMEMGILDA